MSINTLEYAAIFILGPADGGVLYHRLDGR